MNRSRHTDSNRDHQFPTTQWTLVNEAGNDLSEHQREALNEVLTQYWPAIRAHLISKRRVDPHEADDLVQNFIKDRVLEGNLLATAAQDRGRFRALLAKSLENYAANELRKRNAEKRLPDRAVNLDPKIHPRDASDSTRRTDAAWAQDTLGLVLERMQAECQSSGRPHLWRIFQARIVGPILEGTEAVAYESILGEDFSSVSQAQNALVTAKRIFSRTMKAVLVERGTPQSEIDDEIRELERCLSAY